MTTNPARSFISRIRHLLGASRPPSTSQYWQSRYAGGGNSGPGSYNHLAEFKAEVLNRFIKGHGIGSVMEFGCGDGNQLRLADYPLYFGYDISPDAVALCRQMFAGDSSKSFSLVSTYSGQQAELTISLDVIFHLLEDNLFDDYMRRLFDASSNFVVIYSSNTDDNSGHNAAHVRHRKFNSWVEENRPGWQLLEHIPNRYPYNGDFHNTSFSDFYIYQKL